MLTKIKDNIYDAVNDQYPVRGAMFLKNWKRYETCINFLLANGLKKEHTILDFGCGFPFVAKILLELGYNVTPYEPYAGEGELAIAELLGIRDIYKTELFLNAEFDFVLMIDVIEHLSIIKPVMQEVNKKTKQNGFLFVSTPNVLRIEMWIAFILRQTGHPQPLMTYLRSNDNYSNHQREFSQKELNTTLKHFGFNVISAACSNTYPTHAELNGYHRLLGEKVAAISTKKKLFNQFIKVSKTLFPSRLTNNLLVIGQKE